VKVANYCDPCSAGILTCITSLETCVESYFCHRTRTIHNSGLFSFVLVRMVRSCVYIIKLSNRISKMIILKIVILAASEDKSMFESRTVPFYGNPLNSAHRLFLNGRNH
jgi:hypothetical protein